MAKIHIDHLDIVFPVVRDKGLTFKEFVIGMVGGKVKRRIDRIHALKDVSLQLGDGARIGIIGHNGAGKSTLLRAMAGIYPPECGTIDVEGKLCSLFDITLGFEREASGRDNIRYRAFLQGETPTSLRAKVKDIADFCELGDFLDLPLKCYSAGMITRLAFAIATAGEPEILLIDEVFGTGDLIFREKAKERLTRMIDTARIIVMVGHDLASIESFCETVIWMDQGRICQVGPAREVLAAYQQAVCSHSTGELVARYRGVGDGSMYVGRLLDIGGELRAQIIKSVRGQGHVLQTAPVFKTAGRLRFDAVGSSLRLFLDNQLLVETVDGELTAGSVGMRARWPGATFERFSARALGQEDHHSVHPLGGTLLVGPWDERVGGFSRDGDRWFANQGPISLSVLRGIEVGDVSVACDVDLSARQAQRAA